MSQEPAEAGPRRRHAGRVLLVCAAVLLLAVFVSHAPPAAAATPAAIALVIAALGFRWPASTRLAAVSAVVAAILEPATVILPWTVVGVCLSVVVSDSPRLVAEATFEDLSRHLERCRRRGEPAFALFFDMPADPAAIRNLLRAARITDSLVVHRSGRRCQVYGLLEGGDVTRVRAEARFLGAVDTVPVVLGWASYPADGLTLDALLEKARGSAAPAMATGTHPSGKVRRRRQVPRPARPAEFAGAIQLRMDDQ